SLFRPVPRPTRTATPGRGTPDEREAIIAECPTDLAGWKRGKRSEVTEMGWDKGRYYTRSKKVNGRVVRRYVGTGRLAELSAELDALEREWRRMDALTLRLEKDKLALDPDLKMLIETA